MLPFSAPLFWTTTGDGEAWIVTTVHIREEEEEEEEAKHSYRTYHGHVSRVDPDRPVSQSQSQSQSRSEAARRME